MARYSRQTRSILLGASALAGALTLICSPAVAQEPTYTFDLPAQPLDAALRAFASQARQQVIFTDKDTLGRRAPSLSGDYSVDGALDVLLAGTDLQVHRTSKGVLTITDASDPQSGSAAGDGADQGTVQALIVTAQKREENIQDVPIAMSAFSQEDLTRSQVTGGPDLMTQIPNFTFTKTNFTGYSIQIRGIGTQAISATTDAAVAVAFNNTPFIRNRFFEQEFYDLARVEVLRGPQGTLYGRNATAGVVNIISAKPTFNFDSKASIDLGNYNSHRLEGMINLPIVQDKVALRLAGAWTKRDGYDTNQITGQQIDGRDLWSTRLSLRIEPTDHIKANLIWEHFQEDDDRLRSGKQLCKKDLKTEIEGIPLPPLTNVTGDAASIYTQGCVASSPYSPDSFQTPNGFALPYYTPLTAIGLPATGSIDPYLSTTQSRDLRVIESTIDPQYRAKSDLGELQISVDMGHGLTVTSETGYNSDFLFSAEDYNRFNTTPGAFNPTTEANQRQNVLNDGVFCDPQVGCANRLVGEDLSTAASRQFSQEFRLSSDFSGPFNFSLGANFLRYDTEDKYYVFFNSLTLFSAILPFRVSNQMPPWAPGVSDNHECLRPGVLPGDITKLYHVTGCIYIDPNPIGSLNDLGHNYFLSKNPYKLISYATFGEAYYEITPTLKLTAGLRWTVDKKEAPQIPSWLLANQSAGYPVFEVIRQEWREPTGRLALDWKPQLSFTEQTLLYASYAHGYKAGGANPPPPAAVSYGDLAGAVMLNDLATHPRTFAPEFVNAFEIGTKNTLLDGALTLNADAFYYDYTGYQISQIIDRSAVNYNFDAKVWGAELEVDWRPLENLRLGFKGGYEMTRVADGMKAVDVMDRTAGHTDWIVARPFPTVPSNCILPISFVTFGGRINAPYADGGYPGPCVLAYQAHVDPVTFLPYVPNPTVEAVGGTVDIEPLGPQWAGYPGFDPSTAPNNGEGFYKNLGGNELPNAPKFTATMTADYTVPLPNDWLATLHADFYYQAEAWTRIFNMPGYDKLKAYNNVNVAAIFSNEDRGWQVMAYVKNVFNKDNITGAFLNSDDTGLTTNVFLNEPRLYGLRVTKQWEGSLPWLNDRPHDPNTPYSFQVELGGVIEHQEAPYQPITPSIFPALPASLDTRGAQNDGLDWGDGREVKITYTPSGDWFVSADVRIGKVSGDAKLSRSMKAKGGCALKYELCVLYPTAYQQPTNYVNTSVHEHEEHVIVDFLVGKAVGIGALDIDSKIGLGLRYAHLKSETGLDENGIPDWEIPAEKVKYTNAPHDRLGASLLAKRSFEGAGPVLSWDASKRLVGNDELGHADLDWSALGGVLFGKQTSGLRGSQTDEYTDANYLAYYIGPSRITKTPVDRERSKPAAVPVLDLSLGLSYAVDRFKVGGGYRWERYFNAIDGGDSERKTFDRTIDGPYFKVSIGFGG